MRARSASALALVLLLTGCAGGRLNNGLFQADVAGGRYEAAYRQLESAKKDDVSVLLDRGLVLQALGRYEELARLLTGRAGATAEDGIRWVQQLTADLDTPPLGTYGVTVDHVTEVVDKTAVASSTKANPIPLTREELTGILLAAI